MPTQAPYPCTLATQIHGLLLCFHSRDSKIPLSAICVGLLCSSIFQACFLLKGLGTHAGSKQRITLNSADRIYAELRDLSFAAVGAQLRQRAMAIQSDYKTSKVLHQSEAPSPGHFWASPALSRCPF